MTTLKPEKLASTMAPEAILQFVRGHLGQGPIAGEFRIANGERFVGLVKDVKDIEISGQDVTIVFHWTRQVREGHETVFKELSEKEYIPTGPLQKRTIRITFISKEIAYSEKTLIIKSTLGETYFLSIQKNKLDRVAQLNPSEPEKTGTSS